MPDVPTRQPLIGADLVAAVFDELDWAPGVDARRITIARSGPVITVSGVVADVRARNAATAAALRTREIGTLDNQLTTGRIKPADDENTRIAQAVEVALQRALALRGMLRAEVSEHVVTLSGTVDWGYEREAARRCLDDIAEVHHVINRIGIVRRPSPGITMGLVHSALANSSPANTDVVHVSILDSEITLTGIVQSSRDRQDAEQAAWASPHVTIVHNNLTIRPL